VADRALVLYALARRGAIELVVSEAGGDPGRVIQADRARMETDRWLQRESISPAVSASERSMFEAPSGSWPAQAVKDALWCKEALGTLLWALQHLDALPAPSTEFDQSVLDEVVTRSGSVESFRANGSLRSGEEIEAAWLEADAWFGATEGRAGDDAVIASIESERFRALSWLRDDAAAPA
jgi:Domain of unknown function (DUF4272)